MTPPHATFVPHTRKAVSLVLFAVLALILTVVSATSASAAPAGSPVGKLNYVVATPTGIHVVGWTVDPDTSAPLWVSITSDGRQLSKVLASVDRPAVAKVYPAAGSRHGYDVEYPMTSGTHKVCVTAVNVIHGVSMVLGCQSITLRLNPFGAFTSATQALGGVAVRGFAIDPDTQGPVTVSVKVDGVAGAPITAGAVDASIAKRYPAYPGAHAINSIIPVSTAGTHSICLVAVNVGGGVSMSIGCRTVTVAVDPVGSIATVPHPRGSTSITVHGWAVDPQTTGAITIGISVDGAISRVVTANVPVSGLTTPFAATGVNHGFSSTIPVSNAAHTVCATAVNVGAGANVNLGCQVAPSWKAVVPSIPAKVTAVGGTGSAVVRWSAPSDNGGSAITAYTLTPSPDGTRITVKAPATSATISLAGGKSYTFRVTAVNAVGSSLTSAPSPAVAVKAPSIAPVTSPALISTSRYLRNLNGGTGDVARTHAMGATDATYNPANHRYLTLLQIGGQTTTGVVLSATSTYLSNAQVVTALKAYLDGYASTQRPNAPATIAIGTNNDMTVSAVTGRIWAQQVINPLMTYARKYPNMSIVGANDIEPGFIGTVAASTAWVQGFLGATTARFVFNGSADGCGWTTTGTRCNNGWSAAALQSLAGGLAPTRILALPQIYNSTMSKQWKYISLTGVVAGRTRINFGGPLTEFTACQQAGSCSSMTNNSAWSALWGDLHSDSRLAISSLPFGTDLRIN